MSGHLPEEFAGPGGHFWNTSISTIWTGSTWSNMVILHIYGGSTEIILCFYMRDWCFVHPSSHFHYIFLFKFLSTRFLEKLRYTHTRSKTHITVPRDSSTRCTRVLLCSYSSLFTNSTNYTTVASTKVCFLSPYKHTCYFLPWFIIVSKKTRFNHPTTTIHLLCWS